MIGRFYGQADLHESMVNRAKFSMFFFFFKRRSAKTDVNTIQIEGSVGYFMPSVMTKKSEIMNNAVCQHHCQSTFAHA